MDIGEALLVAHSMAIAFSGITKTVVAQRDLENTALIKANGRDYTYGEAMVALNMVEDFIVNNFEEEG